MVLMSSLLGYIALYAVYSYNLVYRCLRLTWNTAFQACSQCTFQSMFMSAMKLGLLPCMKGYLRQDMCKDDILYQ